MNNIQKKYTALLKISENKLYPENKRKKLIKKLDKKTRKKIKCYLLLKKISVRDEELLITGYLIVRSKNKDLYTLLMKSGSFIAQNIEQPLKKSRLVVKLPFVNTGIFKISASSCLDDFLGNELHGKIKVQIPILDNHYIRRAVSFSLIDRITRNSKSYRVSNLKVLLDKSATVFFRQSTNNKLLITIRETKKSDLAINQLKINTAWLFSLIFKLFWKPKLLYEKQSERFEESGSVLFRRSLELGIKNIYFILDEDSKDFPALKKLYGERILNKHSFTHYLAFFCSKTFIGTEVIAHAIDLRIANRRAVRKINDQKNTFVFLQHGVMYMVSLASKRRKANRKNGGVFPKKSKIVTSSDLEAEHFIIYGNYNPEDIYVSGLPKFDNAIRNHGAKKIVIMPTWRPWEYNTVRVNPTTTTYYNMLLDMYNAVPKSLKKHVVVLPHPLFKGHLDDTPFKELVDSDSKYDDILKDCELLITDYSSIAFDAFYRGAKVCFWWKEKEAAMKEYGGFLMLNKSNTFGDISVNKKQLSTSIKSVYGKKQSTKYIKNFRELVEFKDGNNTDRLIGMLTKDRLI